MSGFLGSIFSFLHLFSRKLSWIKHEAMPNISWFINKRFFLDCPKKIIFQIKQISQYLSVLYPEPKITNSACRLSHSFQVTHKNMEMEHLPEHSSKIPFYQNLWSRILGGLFFICQNLPENIGHISIELQKQL